jgi:hypothetical protein
MTKISSIIVGAAGEYHVLSQLLRRGWIAALAPDGAPNMDILVTDEKSNRLCAIQVKTRRDIGYDKGWHMKPKHEELVADDLFYIFVDVGKQPSDDTKCYVLPSVIVADSLKRCHQAWLETPGIKGKPHKDSNVRRLKPDHSNINPPSAEGKAAVAKYSNGWLDHYREKWSVLGLPEVETF